MLGNLMARLDSGNGGRKRERERRGMTGGLSLASPWRDAVGEIMEVDSQALADRRARLRPAWPVRRSAINDKVTVSPTTCVR